MFIGASRAGRTVVKGASKAAPGAGGINRFIPNSDGYFGSRGQSGSSRVRNINGGNQAALDFFDDISKNFVNERSISGGGKIRTLSDGTNITYRPSSVSDGTPAIGFASLYCPEVIEIDGCIFIAEFYNDNIDSLKKQYQNRKDIEMFVNSWSLETLLANNENLNYDINYIHEFAKAIKYFWELRMKTLFPDRKIMVEIGEEIMGEIGLSVTLYQE